MQVSFRQLTGAFRPLRVKQQIYRVPAPVSSLCGRVASANSSTQAAAIVWRGFASVYSAQTAQTLDQPTDSNAHRSVEVPDEFGTVLRQGVRSTLTFSRPSSAAAHVLDDSQHSIKASSVPAYAWPFLAKLHLAGNGSGSSRPASSVSSMTHSLQVMMSLWWEEQCETCC